MTYDGGTAQMPDLSQVSDGTYRGNYKASGVPVKVSLEVSVQNKKIINILEHTGSNIGKRAERIIDQIINLQSLDVDVVTGATVSSKAILKAVENALK